MARSRRRRQRQQRQMLSGRDVWNQRSIASSAAPDDPHWIDIPHSPEDDPTWDDWIEDIREDPSIRHVDLTNVQDRRRYHPNRDWDIPKTVRGLRTRIVVVPEGHRLARQQTYGGRYSLREVLRGDFPHDQWPYRKRWTKNANWRYGSVTRYTKEFDVPRRLGFHMPWQVIICVRRRRRSEVLHALKKTGRLLKGRGGGGFKWRVRRNKWSEVRC